MCQRNDLILADKSGQQFVSGMQINSQVQRDFMQVSPLLDRKKNDLRTNLILQNRPFVISPAVKSFSVDRESELLTLNRSLLKNPIRDLALFEYQINYLPSFGNPQQVDRVIEPSLEIGGWIRGGRPTR